MIRELLRWEIGLSNALISYNFIYVRPQLFESMFMVDCLWSIVYLETDG